MPLTESVVANRLSIIQDLEYKLTQQNFTFERLNDYYTPGTYRGLSIGLGAAKVTFTWDESLEVDSYAGRERTQTYKSLNARCFDRIIEYARKYESRALDDHNRVLRENKFRAIKERLEADYPELNINSKWFSLASAHDGVLPYLYTYRSNRSKPLNSDQLNALCALLAKANNILNDEEFEKVEGNNDVVEVFLAPSAPKVIKVKSSIDHNISTSVKIDLDKDGIPVIIFGNIP